MSLTIHSSAHEAALLRLMSTSRRAAVDVARQEFGLMLSEVARYTPPASEGVTGKKAEMQGRAAVAADIYAAYGTPGDAYDAISAASSPQRADAFWVLHRAGDDTAAGRIVREVTSKSFGRFDGGAVHKRQRVGVRNRRRGAPVFFVSDLNELESYVKSKQGRVWWLASGWAPALRALGRPLPTGVGKQGAPGTLKVRIDDARIQITAVDSVSWASKLPGIGSRIRWALQRRTSTLQRRWDHFIQRQTLR
jgi:hypothetical protein